MWSRVSGLAATNQSPQSEGESEGESEGGSHSHTYGTRRATRRFPTAGTMMSAAVWGELPFAVADEDLAAGVDGRMIGGEADRHLGTPGNGPVAGDQDFDVTRGLTQPVEAVS